MLKSRELIERCCCLRHFPLVDGFAYMKATRVWNNCGYKGRYCTHKGKHATAIGGREGDKWSQWSKHEKYRIPPELCDEIGKHIKYLEEEIPDE